MSRLTALLLLLMAVLGCGGPSDSASGWQEYRAWVHSPWVVDFAHDLDAWNASADAGPAAILAAARSLIEDLDDAMVWLDTHPPEPCYADLHQLDLDWMTELHGSLDGLLDAYARQDGAAAPAAMDAMVQGLETRARAGAAYDVVRC
jgi:hypothetical protein